MHEYYTKIDKFRKELKDDIANDFEGFFKSFDPADMNHYNIKLIRLQLSSIDAFYAFIREKEYYLSDEYLIETLNLYSSVLNILTSIRSSVKNRNDINNVASTISDILNRIHQWFNNSNLFILPFLPINDSLNSKIDDSVAKKFLEQTNTFESKREELAKHIEQAGSKANELSQFVENRLSSLQFAASSANIAKAKEENKKKITFWSRGVGGSVVALGIYLVIVYCNSESVFTYASTLKNDLQTLYIVKNSLLSVSIFGVLTYTLTTCIGLLKSYMNIDTVYSHKLALLNSFNDLTGAESLSNEKSKIVEKLVDQIITSDNININASNHAHNQISPPSIVQSIIEKLPSSEK